MQRAAFVALLLAAGAASAGNVQGQLASDTTWTAAGSPYTLTGDVIVPSWVTLTIEPGVQVVAASTDGTASGSDTGEVELIVQGALKIMGTDMAPVTFKGATAGKGSWYGVRVEAGTASVIAGAVIRDATYGFMVTGSGTTATLTSSTLTGNTYSAYAGSSGTLAMDHTVAHANTYGVYVATGTATLDYDTLANNSYGVYLGGTGYNLTLRNSISANNSYGVYRSTSYSGTSSLSNNDVWGNSSGDYSGIFAGSNSFSANPLFVSSSNFRITSYSPARKAASDGSSDIGALAYSGDASTSLAGTIYEDTTLSGALSLKGDLTIPTGVTVTLAPGTTFTAAASDSMASGADTSLVEVIARGTLQALGTDSSPVTFKGSTTGKGQWYGVRVVAGTTSTLSGVLIRDASYGLMASGSGTTATLTSSTLTSNTYGAYADSSGTLAMDHTVAHANTYGVYVATGTASLNYDTLVNNSYGVYLGGTGYNLTLRNSISANNSYGVYRSTSYSGTSSLSNNDVWGNSSGDYSSVTAGSNSFSANPLFVSSSNFRITSYSPARKAASDGSSDIGALAYSGDASTSLAGTIYEDTTLSGALTLKGDLTIPTGVTVTLAPGTTFTAAASDSMASGADTSLVEVIAQGTLQALGTDSSPVTFKGATTGKGQWYGVRVVAGTTSTLSGVLIRDASYGLMASGSGTTATLTSSTLTSNTYGAYADSSGTLAMDHTVAHANTYGVYVATGTASLNYDTLVNNSYGVYLGGTGYNLTLRNSISANNSYGVYRSTSYSGTSSLSNNDVWGNSSGGDYSGIFAGSNSFSANPLFVSSSNFRITSYSPARKAASDGSSDIGALAYTGDVTPFLAGTIYEDTTLSGALSLKGDLTIPTGVTVTLAPGTTFTAAASDSMASGADTSLVEVIARGTLQALGTDSSPVTFKGATTGKGQWYGVRVVAGTTSTLSSVLIRDAVYGLMASGSGTTATLTSSTLTSNTYGAYADSSGTLAMDHTVAHANTYGAYVATGTASLTYDTLVNNSYGVYLGGSSYNLTLRNSISANNSYGVYRSTSYSGTSALSYNDVWGNSSGDYSSVTAGSNSLSANPLFASSTDFHLQATSPCRGTAQGGTDMGALPYRNDTVVSVQLVPASTTVGAAQTTAFTARAYNSAGDPVSDVAFTWSAKAAAGSIDSMGMLTASCTTGTVTAAVTATSPNGVSATADVTIVPGPATRVTVSPPAVGIEAGASRSFTATVQDVCGNFRTSDTVSWSTATSTGTITSLGLYTATCTPGNYTGAVIASLGSLSGTANVFVSTGPLAKLTVSPSSPSLETGAQQTFTAVPTDSCGNTRTDSVSWSVINGGGTINGTTGVFTAGTKPGFYSDTIQATAGGKVALTNVTVLGGEVASLELTPSSATVDPKGQVTFTATARDAFGNIITATPTWSVVGGGGDIDSAGTFTAGTVAGTYANTVRAVAGSASTTATVTVRPGTVDRIELSPSPALLAPSGSVRFTARVLDVYGNVRTSDTVTWSLSLSSAGTLNTTTGDFTASTVAGTYTDAIRAEAGGRSASATVTIRPDALAKLELTPTSASPHVGESVAFTARGQDAYGNEVIVSPLWEVISGGGTINASGTFTAGTVAGTYTDTVRASAEGLSASATVVVRPGPVAGVSIAPSNPSLPTRGTLQFTAKATDAFGNELSTSPRTWSAQAAAGTITASGLFTAGGTAGYFSDAIQVEVDGVKATTSVELSRRVARVEVARESATVPAGGTATFTARAFDATGAEVTDVAFTWSAQAAAGSIDTSGRLTVACSPTASEVSVSAMAEGITGSVGVTIVPGPAANLAVSPASITLEAKGTTTFTASATDRCGNALPSPSVAWSTASGAGTINAVGQYTAPCSVGNLPGAVVAQLGSLSANASVTVTPGVLAHLTLSPTAATLAVTESQRFSVEGADACGNAVTPPVSWEVVSGGGSVDGTGLFTAGTTAGNYPDTLRVSANGLSASASLTVLPGVLATLSLSPESVELLPAGKATFTARGADRFGNTVAVSPAWSVVAGGGSIQPSGEFTAGTEAGTYTGTVRAEDSGVTASATVIVLSGAVTRIELTPTAATLEPGQVRSFTARAFDVFGNPSDAPLTWSVAAPEAGTIDADGFFTAGTKAGSYPEAVRVSAGGVLAVADVTVVAGPTARVELSPLAPEVKAGGTVRFTARALDAHGNERPGPVQWTSDPAAGSITSEGVFTAGNVAGTYSAAVTASFEGVSTSTSVKVLPVSNPDGGTGGDGGTDPGPQVPDGGGCGCSSAADASAPLMALLVLALAATRRRTSRV